MQADTQVPDGYDENYGDDDGGYSVDDCDDDDESSRELASIKGRIGEDPDNKTWMSFFFLVTERGKGHLEDLS